MRASTSFERMIPDELPIFLISTVPITWPRGSGAIFVCSFMANLRYTKRITEFGVPFNRCFTFRTRSAHPFQLVDHARNHRQAAVPEFGVPGVQPERPEQFGIMLGLSLIHISEPTRLGM